MPSKGYLRQLNVLLTTFLTTNKAEHIGQNFHIHQAIPSQIAAASLFFFVSLSLKFGSDFPF